MLFTLTTLTIETVVAKETMKLMAFQGEVKAGHLIDSQGGGWPFCLERQRKTVRRLWLIVNIFARKHGKISARKSGESRGKVPEKAGR